MAAINRSIIKTSLYRKSFPQNTNVCVYARNEWFFGAITYTICRRFIAFFRYPVKKYRKIYRKKSREKGIQWDGRISNLMKINETKMCCMYLLRKALTSDFSCVLVDYARCTYSIHLSFYVQWPGHHHCQAASIEFIFWIVLSKFQSYMLRSSH